MTVSVMLLVVVLVTMDWKTFIITTEEQKPPLPRGWWEHRIFWWERQNGGWRLMPISKNRGGGYLVAFTMSSFANRCSCMPPQQVRVNATVPSARARGSHCQNEIWGQNPPPWSLSATTLQAKTLRTCIGTCTNCRGYPEEADVKRPWRSASVKRSWTPLRNASGLSSQRQSRSRCLPMPLGLIPVCSLLLQIMAHMGSSLPWKKTCTRKWWP